MQNLYSGWLEFGLNLSILKRFELISAGLGVKFKSFSLNCDCRHLHHNNRKAVQLLGTLFFGDNVAILERTLAKYPQYNSNA